MTQPQNIVTLHNPLHKFRSYSVHYILLAARSTEEAKKFISFEESEQNATLAAINRVQKLGEPVIHGNATSAFLLIDTRRFSQFSINSVKYTVGLNGLEKRTSHGNFFGQLDMEMTDSVGITFINFIRWVLVEKVQTNYDGVIFMLRILFVGHNDDGTTETVQGITIPMYLNTMDLSLDHARGVYTMSFFPTTNFDTVKGAKWLTISANSSYTTGAASNRLVDIINNFENALNTTSADYYNKASIALRQADRKTTSTGQFGRLVKYQITIPKEWEDYTFIGAGDIQATETKFKNVDDSENKSQENKIPPGLKAQVDTNPKVVNSSLSVPAGTSIPSVLDTILGQVKEIAKNGTESEGKITLYKYLIGTTSTDSTVTVHVDVIPFIVPKIEYQEDGKDSKKAGYNEDDIYQTVDGKRVPKNYAEFNYIFTGKNVDIMEFDMKIPNLTFLISSNMTLGPGLLSGLGSNTSPGETTSNENNDLVYARPYDPLLPPLNTASTLENFTRYTTTLTPKEDKEIVSLNQEYARNLSMFYATSPVETQITIKGNPLIMEKFNIDAFLPQDVGSGASDSGFSGAGMDKEQYRKALEEHIVKVNKSVGDVELIRGPDGSFTANTLRGSSYVNSPVFVKVNVFGPNVDFRTSDTVKGEDFSTAILQDNYYIVMNVENQITDGIFTQTLKMNTHNVFGNVNGEGQSKSTNTMEPKKV